jgi:hypothetical protein
MHKEFILVNYNSLLHVSTLLGHLQGETFSCRYTMLHYGGVNTLKRVHASINGAVHSQQHILAKLYSAT